MRRLLMFILFFAVFLAFIVLNIDNKCDISLGFVAFSDIPVFLSSLFSFVLGMLFAVPLVFSLRKKTKNTGRADPSAIAGREKGRWGLKGRKASQGAVENSGEAFPHESNDEKSPFGID